MLIFPETGGLCRLTPHEFPSVTSFPIFFFFSSHIPSAFEFIFRLVLRCLSPAQVRPPSGTRTVLLPQVLPIP